MLFWILIGLAGLVLRYPCHMDFNAFLFRMGECWCLLSVLVAGVGGERPWPVKKAGT